VLFSAVRGGGAFAEPLFEAGERTRISVSAERDAKRLRVCEPVEAGHSKHDQSAHILAGLGVSTDPVRVDSQAKYAIVARGEAELYWRLPTRADYREKIWDHAGGCLLVQEAGGTVTDVDGKPLDFSRGRELTENRGAVVSHGPFHARVLELIKSASQT
jgi:3'(2'), 5'-bisphosphate nucleotidase